MNKLTVIASLVSLSIGLSACTKQKTAEESAAEAKVLIAEGNIETAVIELKNGISLDSNNAHLRTLLGKAYLQQGLYINAEKELRRALELGIDMPSVAVPLTLSLMKMREFEEVYTLVDDAVQVSDGDYIAMLTFAGMSAIQDRKVSLAKDYLQQAVSINEGAGYAKLAKGYLAFLNRDFEETQHIVNELVDSTPSISEALLLKGYLLSEIREYGPASEAFVAYLQKHPKAYQVNLLIINSLVGAQRLDEALKIVDAILANFEQARLAEFYKAQILFSKEEYASSLEFAEKAINGGLDFEYSRIIAGVSAFRLERYENAYHHLLKVKDDLDSYPDIQRLYSFIQLKLGLTNEVKGSIESFTGTTELDSVLIANVGLKLIQEGDIEGAKTVFAAAGPNIGARSDVLEGLLKLERADISGINNLESAIDVDESLSNAWFTVALAHLQNGSVEKALKTADSWIGTDPASGLTLKGIIYIRLGEYDQAENVLKQAVSENNEHYPARFNFARSLALKGDRSAAKQALETVISDWPDNLKAMDVYISLDSSKEHYERSLGFIENHESNYPDLLSPKIAKALIYQFRDEPSKTIELLLPLEEQLNSPGWRLLGDSQFRMKDLKGALSSYRKWKAKYPNVPEAWYRELFIYDTLHDYKSALELIQFIDNSYELNTQLKMLKLDYQSKSNLLDDADNTLEQLVTSGVESSTMKRLEGQLALLKGEHGKAAELLMEYHNVVPSFESAMLLARSLAKTERLTEANKIIEQEIENKPLSGMRLLALANFYSKTDQLDKSSMFYRKVLKLKAGNVIALNNLALVESRKRNFKEAMEYAEKAHALLPEHPKVLDTYGWIIYLNGDPKRAHQYLSKASKLAPNDAEVQTHYQEVLSKLN